MMLINLSPSGKKASLERAEARSHAKHVFSRVLPAVGALTLGGLFAYQRCMPEIVEVTPQVCENLPDTYNGKKVDGRERDRKERRKNLCTDEKKVRNRLSCAAMDSYDHPPGPEIASEALRVIDGPPNPRKKLDAFTIIIHARRPGIEDKLVLELPKFYRAINAGADASMTIREIRDVACEYSTFTYQNYSNPFTDKLKALFNRTEDGGEKIFLARLLIEILAAHEGQNGSALFPFSLVANSDSLLVPKLFRACGFQAQMGHAVYTLPETLEALSQKQVTELIRARLSHFEEVFIWINTRGSGGGFVPNGAVVLLDIGLDTDAVAADYRGGTHELVHHLSSLGPFEYLNAPVLYEWLTEMITRQVVLHQLGLSVEIKIIDERVEWNGFFLPAGSYWTATDSAFLKLFAFVQEKIGFGGILDAYLHNDFSHFKEAMDMQYGPGAFDYVFNTGARLENLLGMFHSSHGATEARARLLEVEARAKE